MPPPQRRVLVVGGSFAGLCCGRDLAKHFLVTIVDAKEFFEYTPGVLRAYVKPKHLDALTFTLQPVIETRMGCKFIWGEVKSINAQNKTAEIKPMFSDKMDTIDFDFCIVASGCGFGPFHKWGESLWFPTIHADAIPQGSWPHIDERFLEGRRRHILEEFHGIQQLDNLEKGGKKGADILIVGAGFIGVEWVTELDHFFKNLKLTIVDMLPNCLGPLPKKAADYCARYMKKKGIKQYYGPEYGTPRNPEDRPKFFRSIELPETGPDKQYICVGVKASNYFMPPEVLSKFGPGGGNWILMDATLAVKTQANTVWCEDDDGFARIYAIGDCNYGCIEPEEDPRPKEKHGTPYSPPDIQEFGHKFPIAPIPKISYPGEEEAIIACKNIEKIDKIVYRGEKTNFIGEPLKPYNMHWPWGAGMFATSLGPGDACFVAGANFKKGSGAMVLKGQLSAVQKEIIEASKTDECAYGIVGRCIWHFVHHTPIHLWGGGPLWGY